MAENYDENEVAVHQLLNEVTGGAWLATPRYYELQAAVLKRMAGPGEVVVPVKGRLMDTAPKDGRAVLVWDGYKTDGGQYSDGRLRQTGKDGFAWVVARFDTEHGWHVAASVVGGGYIPLRNPVGWMPLPARPNGGTDDTAA